MDEYATARQRMVEEQLRARGISDERVLKAMSEIPREAFVTGASKFMAYHDFPLPIGKGQTISQPYMVALMTELLQLKGGEKVLEVGTGSGYQAAILSRLCKKVITIEIDKDLAARARERLIRLGCTNVKVIVGDGSQGYVYAAPYDAIIVTAGAEKVPRPLIDQLKTGGRLVIPVGGRAYQTLKRYTKKVINNEEHLVEEKSVECRFVPLRGKYGWHT